MDLEQAINQLSDDSKSWVDRRDAADALRDIATGAIAALQGQSEAKDVDVRMAVQGALDALNAPAPVVVDGGAGSAIEKKSLATVVRECEKPGRRDVSEDGDGFKVAVTLKNGRNQTVFITPYQRKDGIKLVRVFSYCGVPDEASYLWSLRANGKLVQSAVAILDHEGEDHLVLTRTFLEGEISKPEMHTAIKEIAHYADWLENKLSGKDDF